MNSSPLRPLSADARQALTAYRDASPGSRRRAENLGAVRRRVSAEAPPKVAAAAGLMWPLGWGLASAAAAAGLVWGLIEVRSVEPEASQVGTVAPSVVAKERPARAVPKGAAARRVVSESPSDPASVQRPAPRAEPQKVAPIAPDSGAVVSDLREETRRLRQVRASIASASWEDAARDLAAYTHAFPNGALREDAQAYRIIVRCEQGKPATALRRAFDDRYPASPHAVRIDAACRSEDKP